MEDLVLNTIWVVGIGAGQYEGMTVGAVRALEAAEVIVGYTVYCELVRPYFPDKEFLATPMTREIERCRLALESARSGRRTAMICSGDAGVYGMASPILELADEYGVAVEIVPGVTAALSGAALLGSPLTADFMTLSLSDRLTPWETIERRIEAAAACDVCLAIYNPSSKTRADHLRRCCGILLRSRAPDTVCGLAHNVGRAGERIELTTLAALADCACDMFTTVFIGNSTTKVIGGRMVTPRGYKNE